MISKFYIAICAGLFASLVSPRAVLAADMTPVPVASYTNGPEVVEKEGKRAAKILGEKKVKFWQGDQLFNEDYWTQWASDHKTGSAVVLFVPKVWSSEARLLLARVIKAESLRITLLGDDAKSVTLESILEEGKKP